MKILSSYIHAFTNLRRDYKKGGAPHKPVLLLSIIQLFESKQIDSERIFITPELVGTFKSTWNALVTTGLYEIRIEYKSNIYRIFCCFDEGQLIVLFNGFQKKTQKTPQKEIDKALQLMNKYFASKK